MVLNNMAILLREEFGYKINKRLKQKLQNF